MIKDTKNLFDPKEYVAKKGHVPRHDIHCAVLVFDVVAFSEEMNNQTMNNIVNKIQSGMMDVLEPNYYWAERKKNSGKNNLLLVPTGDGYAVAINNSEKDEEILNIAAELYKEFTKEKLRFRMGIAKGNSILTIDLNENLNIFGYGIVMATRVCSVAQESQILVHNHFAETLSQRKNIPELTKVVKEFKVKHGLKFTCCNYHKEGEFGINPTTYEK